MTVWPDYGSPGAPNMDPYYRSPAQVADDEAEHQAATDNLRAALMDAVVDARKAMSRCEVAALLRETADGVMGTSP